MAECKQCGKNGKYFRTDIDLLCIDCRRIMERENVSDFTMSKEVHFERILDYNKAKYVDIGLDVDHKLLLISCQTIIFNNNIGDKKYIQYAVKELNNLQSVDIEEDGCSCNASGALVGGLLFGATGAIVGSELGKNKKKISEMKLVLRFDNTSLDDSVFEIPFVQNDIIKTNSLSYKDLKQKIEELFEGLNFVAIQNKKKNESVENPSQNSIADEILKFKQLLDMGAISQEEYDAAKKKLLGI